MLGASLLPLQQASAANPEQARIAATRADLREVRAELTDAEVDAEDNAIALVDADRQLEAAFDATEAAAQAVRRQGEAVADAEGRLSSAREDLTIQRAQMADRVARLYRQARPDDVIQVLGATSVSQAVRQSAYMSAIGRDDRAAVETLSNAETRVGAEERALQAEEVSLAGVLDEQEALLGEVEEIRNDQALIAAASADLVARLQARESHLADEEQELTRLIAQREAEAAAAAAAAAAVQVRARQAPSSSAGGSQVASSDSTGSGSGSSSAAVAETPGSAEAPVAAAPVAAPPAPSGGGFSWPTSGSVTSEYGQRWGRLHAGMDIANSTGTAIAAAKGGTVIHAGPQGGYGNLVLISHGGGFTTAYAHMSSVAVSAGQTVSTGTFLGGMGCTGSCTGTHVHFEIRTSSGAVNPRSYL